MNADEDALLALVTLLTAAAAVRLPRKLVLLIAGAAVAALVDAELKKADEIHAFIYVVYIRTITTK